MTHSEADRLDVAAIGARAAVLKAALVAFVRPPTGPDNDTVGFSPDPLVGDRGDGCA